MKKQIEVPDKIIELEYNDKVKIYIEKNKIRFDFFCDGTGNSFSLSKRQLWEMIKK